MSTPPASESERIPAAGDDVTDGDVLDGEAQRVGGRWWNLDSDDRGALKWWGLTRIATLIAASAGAWLLATGNNAASGFGDRWLRWDAIHFWTIGQYGYGGEPGVGPQVPLEAFFPGFPITVRPLLGLGINPGVAGLIVSAAALAVACVALRRLADFERGAGSGVGDKAVLLLLVSPYAVFLTAGYSEALFLAFAVTAWFAAKRNHWWLAGLLAAGAATTRVTGLFLAVALIVQFALYAKDRKRNWPALLIPFIPPALYTYYQYRRTGDWLRWLHAQDEGWNRTLTAPWDAWTTTWNGAFGSGQPTAFIWQWRAELIAAVLAVLVVVWLLSRRKWPEAVYVGGQTAALLTSQYYLSVPRAFLLWWPVWIGLGAFVVKRPSWLPWILAVFVPLNVVLVITFTSHAWAG